LLEGPEVRSESRGRANHGTLVNGEQLPPHSGYVIRDEDMAWATNETVSYIMDAFDYMVSEHPRAPRVMMHDLSDHNGGRLSGHRSHQSGRDADIGLYQTRCSDNECPFRRVRASRLDVEREWDLISYWIRHDQVQYIFLDYSLQEPLYEYAQSQGASDSQLREWFQYPSGRRSARGIIRHEPNHDDHIHVRFVCSDDDDECR
ncbi:MAG: penicillin-insensitive murein endopeptidase, partial [Myxococcales bacterium]|nr:penicillin-insensitive murein endopeptidase [Myxococcales bacterium]